MAPHDPGPRRSQSTRSYLRETRAIAAVAVLALVGGIVSDALDAHFWGHHTLIASLAANVVIVALTIAVVNEAVERRSRQRWSVLAQYVMLQLVRDARLVWTEVAELAGLMPSGPYTAESLDEGARAIRDTPLLAAAIGELVADEDRLKQLHDEIARFVEHTDEVLGRWAAVMLNADAYAELIDRHVELAGDLAWLGTVLDHFDPPDAPGWKRRGHPVVGAAHVLGLRIERELDDRQLADRVVAITQLAERLDRGTLEIALRIVPIEWWAARLETAATPSHADAQVEGAEEPPA